MQIVASFLRKRVRMVQITCKGGTDHCFRVLRTVHSRHRYQVIVTDDGVRYSHTEGAAMLMP